MEKYRTIKEDYCNDIELCVVLLYLNLLISHLVFSPGYFVQDWRGSEKLELPKTYDSKGVGEKRKREKTRKLWWMVERGKGVTVHCSIRDEEETKIGTKNKQKNSG